MNKMKKVIKICLLFFSGWIACLFLIVISNMFYAKMDDKNCNIIHAWPFEFQVGRNEVDGTPTRECRFLSYPIIEIMISHPDPPHVLHDEFPPVPKTEGGRYELPDMESTKNVTAICVPKFMKDGKYYFSVFIYDRRRGSKSVIDRYKHYDSLKDVFSDLRNIQIPIRDMNFSIRNFYFGEQAKQYIKTDGIILVDFNSIEKTEIENFIQDILYSKQDSIWEE